MPDGYTNRELDAMLDGLHEKLDAIHEQVKCTNGRVRSLETWKAFITGGLSVLTALVLPLLYIVLKGWAG